MPYRRTPAVQARLDDRRETVLRAAVALLREEGYAGCSMAAVAARAGIGTGSVYQHFAGKSELAVELFRTVAGGEVEAVAAAAARPGSPSRRVAAVVETFAGRALKSPRLAYALLAEPVDAVVDAERLVFRRAFRDVIAHQITDAIASGELPYQEPLLTSAALVGAIGEALVGPLASGSAPDDLITALVAFSLRALGDSADPTRPGPARPDPTRPGLT